MPTEPITDPETIDAYVKTARELYKIDDDLPMEFPERPVVVKTKTGAKVAVWLPVESEDLQA